MAPTSPSLFQEVYARLNEQQRVAVDTLEGPVLVLAGPGSGKTQILTARIAKILLETDAQPSNILAVTFTQSGARNMRERLVSMIGTAAYGVHCTTFHGFCLDVIQSNPHLFPLSPRQQEPISEIDQLAIIEESLQRNRFLAIRPPKNPLYFVRDCLQLIANYKREGLSPVQILQLAQAELETLETEEVGKTERRKRQLQAERNVELSQLYAEYQTALAERHTYDFDDMILWVRDAFAQQPELLLEYQERYQYVLVDEWQDTNQGQLQVLESLVSYWGEAANVFVVGDPNQSIYRFQGASLSNTLRFLDRFPQAKVVALNVGYRCVQPVYDAAAALISHNAVWDRSELQSLSKPLQSTNAAVASLMTHAAPNTLAEASWVAQRIQTLHAEGLRWNDMAILVRKHRHAEVVVEVFQRLGIPVRTSSQESVLDVPLIRQVETLFQFLVHVRQGQEDTDVWPLLRLSWWSLEATDTLKFMRVATDRKQGYAKVWDFWNDDAAVRAAGLKNAEAFLQLRDRLVKWAHAEGTQSFDTYLEWVLREAGVFSILANPTTHWSETNALASWFREVYSWVQRGHVRTLEQLISRLNRMREHGVTLLPQEVVTPPEAVVIMTAHQAKGLEWDAVFVLHLQDGYWGNVRSPQTLQPLPGTVPYAELEKNEANEDERRLLYVALTRAKRFLTLSWSAKEFESGRARELLPSQFLTELPVDLFTPSLPLESEFLQQLARTAAPFSESATWSDTVDREWLSLVLQEFPLSVSALNEFLSCPVAFLLKRVVRVPSLPVQALVIGTAAHAGLERLFRHLQTTNQVLPLSELHAAIDRSVAQQGVLLGEADALAARTKTLMTAYYEEASASFRPPLFVERFFGSSPPLHYDGLRLVGKIDRIDALDSTAKTVRVIDYKTGKPKSRNEILGKTQQSDGGLARQLQFYKLLADLDPSFELRVTEGEFIFLEANASGKFKTEVFPLEEEDTAPLRSVLETVAQSFRTLDFLERPPCGTCDTCQQLGFTHSVVETTLATQQLELGLSE